MIHGSCLCGEVLFEFKQASGPFELCHCNRCRKVSGSTLMAGIAVSRETLKWIAGMESIRFYDAPLLAEPPRYRVCFCGTCGSPVPDPSSDSEIVEIPAALLDDDPGIKPDKHIFAELKAPWHQITDELPQFDDKMLLRYRQKAQGDD